MYGDCDPKLSVNALILELISHGVTQRLFMRSTEIYLLCDHFNFFVLLCEKLKKSNEKNNLYYQRYIIFSVISLLPD